jgi:hypothetical protein
LSWPSPGDILDALLNRDEGGNSNKDGPRWIGCGCCC